MPVISGQLPALQMGVWFLVLLGLGSALVCPDGGPCGDETRGGVKAVMCPDRESECPDDTTCCQLPDGSWGCCPLPKAVCCEDKRHCCPEGTTCDLVHSKCDSPALQSFPLMEKLPARRTGSGAASAAVSVICPGGTSSCADESTCCLLRDGDFGCCPYPEATCCSDRLHCCPSNSVCDLDHGVCRSAENQTPLMKIPAASSDVVCPDQKSACPDETTCCQMSNGTYGCCPLPNAVCCSDHVHCCPAHTRCDLIHEVCSHHQGDAPPLVRMLAPVTAARVPSVPCNDSVACADGNTCCQSAQGTWACCPLPEAVCCEDHLHCCPHGTVCNLAASTCDGSSGGAVTPLHPNTPVFPLQPEDTRCDESTSCPGNSTCCPAPSGGWACCPLPQAVCCDDRLHCCPHGSVCNLEAQTCEDRSRSSLPWFSKVPARTSERSVSRTLSVPWVQKVPALRAVPVQSDRIMCDAQTSCPRGTTCCFMEQRRRWGCCPLPDAVCCKDGGHCCPRGHTCDPLRSSCSRALQVTTRSTNRTEPGAVADVRCDDTSSCASGTTCCRLQSGGWGCCPLVKAVCCEDHEHCCPQGYTCIMKTGTCEKKVQDTPPLQEVVRSEDAAAVPCDGSGLFRCSRRETCCRTSDTEWSCCPAQKAVCCGDSKHCCPAGFSCDPKTGGCVQKNRMTRFTWDSLWRDRDAGL
ncbi:granulin b [Nematolebias whitei]|uniref:granulin b n=1 Tax=Nematolebias whitei TaxID=451745 RepID=UPI00189C4107|nr:granulin b [Nematolebias whitei]